MTKRSRHALNGKIINIRTGLAIYRTGASPYYQARILDPRTGKYKVRSTKETGRINARRAAEEFARELSGLTAPAPAEFSFLSYARRYVKIARRLAEMGERNPNYVRTAISFLENGDYGLIPYFGTQDVRKITTRDWQLFVEDMSSKRPELSSSTRNSIMAAFRNVMKVARDEGVIDRVPDTPRTRIKDNPRPYFQFAPLCAEANDEWEKLKKTAKQLSSESVKVRGIEITDELYDLMLFCLHTFVRPTTSELFALKHDDIAINSDPLRLTIRIRNGKTGFRICQSMRAAVPPYRRLKDRYPAAGPDDYIFMPHYRNRQTAQKNFARQFNVVLERSGLKSDPASGKDRSLYSIRHTAICARFVWSGGKVNIYSLAKNAGTSVDQIERFYAKRLPLTGEMLRNIQHFEAGKNTR